MSERFTPDEIQKLIESGVLTQEKLSILDPNDARVAQKLMQDHQFMGQAKDMLENGLPMLVGGGAASQAAKVLMGAKLPQAAKSTWNLAAPYVAGTVGYQLADKLGMPGWIGAMMGHAGGSKTQFSRPGHGSKAPGQRSAPVAGSKEFGPHWPAKNDTGQQHGPHLRPASGSSSGGPNRPSGGSNLHRQGNVTNPGPGGTGSPSNPSNGPWGHGQDKLHMQPSIDRIQSGRPERRGPMGNEDNWRTLPNKREAGRSGSSDEHRPGSDRRKADDPSTPHARRAEDRNRFGIPTPAKSDLKIDDKRQDDFLKMLGGQRGSRQPATFGGIGGSFDEADRRRAVFGGASSTLDGKHYRAPDKRGQALSKKDIDKLIEQILRMK